MKIQEVLENIDVWSNWADAYKKFVPKFIEEAQNKNNWKDWDKELFFEFFERSNDQCVSSLQQGYYTNIEKESIKNNWSELTPLLKKIANEQDQMDLETYDQIKKWLRNHTSQNRKAAVNRLIASLQPNLLCTIVNEDSLRLLMQKINNLESDANLKINGNWFQNSNTVLNYFKDKIPHKNVYDIMTYPWQTYEFLTKKESPNNTNEMSEIDQISTIKSLLAYKKQIILQGPPGTGKTKLAKEIAESFVFPNKDIDILYFKNIVLTLKNFKSRINYNSIAIESVKDEMIYFEGTRSVPKYNFSVNELYDCYIKKDYLGSNFVEYPQYAKRSLVWNIVDTFHTSIMDDQCKLIQFHPSYTYEDFVRGIVADSKGDRIEYKNVNKTLGLFAEDALRNYKASNNVSSATNIDTWIDSKFEEFKNDIEAKLPEEETLLSGDITIFEVTDTYFKYAKTWQTPGYLKFTEFKKLVKAIILGDLELSNRQLDKEKFIHAHYRYTYYNALLSKFFDNYKYQGESYSEPPKNYVLIIDEINRANLSSVLGELIYALEYRGEAVESMYAVEDNNKFILPPNLYIVGTMNTADRSVGHIDYAIRRRFAFVDVLPKDLSEEEGTTFDSVLFSEVAQLFETNLSAEFEKKDVQLGHSYFIDKSDEEDGAPMSIRLEYEIKPILLEYVKDGVLIGDDIKQKIKDLKTLI